MKSKLNSSDLLEKFYMRDINDEELMLLHTRLKLALQMVEQFDRVFGEEKIKFFTKTLSDVWDMMRSRHEEGAEKHPYLNVYVIMESRFKKASHE